MAFSGQKKPHQAGDLLFSDYFEGRCFGLGHFKPDVDPAIRRNIHWRATTRHHLAVIRERPTLPEQADDHCTVGFLPARSDTQGTPTIG